MPDDPIIRVLREGDTGKTDPFTIAIFANPALAQKYIPSQRPRMFVVDPVMKDQGAFEACARYVDACLFGELPNQHEMMLADPSVARKIRVVTMWAVGLRAEDANVLVGERANSDMIIARREMVAAFLARYGLSADVAFAVSASQKYRRASAWAMTDDDSRTGVRFELDGETYHHRHYHITPGAVAIHVQNRSLTASHEFGHAASSYSNGYLADIYFDETDETDSLVINRKYGRPIPETFCTYDGERYTSDAHRDGLGYPSNWTSYHSELRDVALPALMDNYTAVAAGQRERCQHDRLSRRFLLDRIRAKTAR